MPRRRNRQLSLRKRVTATVLRNIGEGFTRNILVVLIVMSFVMVSCYLLQFLPPFFPEKHTTGLITKALTSGARVERKAGVSPRHIQQTHSVAVAPRYTRNISVVQWYDTNDLTALEACSLVSVMDKNEDCLITMYTWDPAMAKRGGFATYLANKPGFRILPLDLNKILRGTPMWRWYMNMFSIGDIFKELVKDAVRIALLYENGGICLDADFIVQMSLRPLRNVMGYNGTGRSIGRSIMMFDAYHPFLLKCMMAFDMPQTLFIYISGSNIFSVVHGFHCVKRGNFPNDEFCAGMRVLPSSAFYPILQKDWLLLHDESAHLNFDNSYAVCVHGDELTSFSLNYKPGTLLERLAVEHCPALGSMLVLNSMKRQAELEGKH